jgi:uncharacterized protein YxjI
MTTPHEQFAPNPMYVPRFYMRQRITFMVNQYEIHPANPDGSEGPLLAYAQQKRMAFKEEVTFYADEAKSRPVFSFKARKKLDLGSGYDISDESGQPLGFFRKEFGASLLRSTFTLEGPGFTGTGQERSQLVAIVRRFLDIPFLPIHFDYVDQAGNTLLTVERQGTVRDKYTVTVPDERVDFRVAAAVAVAMDALMAR